MIEFGHLIGLEGLPESLHLLVSPSQQLLLFPHPQSDGLQVLDPPCTLILNAKLHVMCHARWGI